MSGINRFLSRREKRSSGGPQKKPRLIVSDDPYQLFASTDEKKPVREEEKKTKAVHVRLRKAGISQMKEPQIEYALRSKYAQGDVDRAYEFLVLLEDAIDGIIREPNPSVRSLGAVNREKATCWLDALLFAMFARLESFETILLTSFNDEPRKRLALLLRFWVNLLRTGKLITIDVTKLIQEAISSCGWPEAAKLHQQDASEAFAFITEQLELPRLTLKMDIYHTGKEDANDDHRLVNERFLQVGIPSESAEGKVITLEDCLENYFNNRIEVRRHLEGKATSPSLTSSDSVKGHSIHTEVADVASVISHPSSPVRSSHPASPNPFSTMMTRVRSTSIIRDRFVGEDDSKVASDGLHGPAEVVPGTRRKNSLRKEVLMPAWQFFSLIPWYTDRAPTSDAQVAAHFSAKRPVLGICLKRYSMLPNGRAVRLDTYVDIPLEIGLPHFIRDDDGEDDGAVMGNFKLSLQSVVCHRGVSVDAGHYVALVRSPASDVVTHPGCPPSRPISRSASALAPEDEWLRFDDLARDRVSVVDIRKALKEESPYLLFYQVQPVEDPVTTSAPPPPYSASIESNGATVPSDGPSPDSSSHRDSSQVRVSFDVPTPEETSAVRASSTSSERRRSLTLDETTVIDDGGPPLSSRDVSRPSSSRPAPWRGTSGESSRLPTAKANGGDEGRLSSTLSRLTARISRDRLRVNDAGLVSSETAASVGVTDHVPGEDVGLGPSKATTTTASRRFMSRARGKARVDLSPHDSTAPVLPDRRPERECLVM